MNDQEMLGAIYQNAEMGIEGISHVLPYVRDPALRKALESQKKEYLNTCLRSDALLVKTGGNRPPSQPVAKLFTRLSANFQAGLDPSPTHIAEMMIKGNVMGATKLVRQLHDYAPGDHNIEQLAQQHIQTTQDNIEQMKDFL